VKRWHTEALLGEAGVEHKLLIDIFLVLQVLGLIGSCALVLTTTLSSRSPRNATWQNFFTSWIISTVSYSLLLFSGQINQPEPTFGVCLAQAGLIYVRDLEHLNADSIADTFIGHPFTHGGHYVWIDCPGE
jgi:hypothetical protein